MRSTFRLMLASAVMLGGATIRSAEPEIREADQAPAGYRLRRAFNDAGSPATFALSADGKRLATPAGKDHAAVWDLETGKKVTSVIKVSNPLSSLMALSPDGGKLAAPTLGRNVAVWDVATGKEIQSFHGAGGVVYALTFSPDGKLLAESSVDSVNVWDVATGKKVREFEEDGHFCGVAFSADGKRLAAAAMGAEQPVYAWNLATGKPLASYKGIAAPQAPMANPGTQQGPPPKFHVGFTPDGARLFLAGKDVTAYGLWATEGGQLLYRGTKTTDSRYSLFSPDGQTVLIANPAAVIFQDVITGKERGRLDEQNLLAFSRDGRTLVGSGPKGLSIWYIPLAAPAKAAKPADRELEELWAELRTNDPRRAARTVERLLLVRHAAVAHIGKQVRPVPSPEPRHIDRLIRDLDSTKFSARQRATDELNQLGAMADDALRRALAAKPPLEVRRRIEQLLERPKNLYPTADPNLLQTLAGILVLEEVGTPEARRVLETLAGGAAKAAVTEEAKAAMRRLARKGPMSER